jgi:predicted regulator of Ras-like GTPase activity (Roadblock/LC7/MglB family)
VSAIQPATTSRDLGGAPTRERAAAAIARLREMAADVRGCAVLGADGELLAASGDPGRWQEAAAVLLGAADLSGDAPAEQVHVATEDGEVFVVRHRGLAAVVVSERFTLASLMSFDMRTVLRDLAAGGA